jgi:hypothetical protein
MRRVVKRHSKKKHGKKVRFGKRTMKWGGAETPAAGGGGAVTVADTDENAQRATITGYFETLRESASELSMSQVIARVCMFALVLGIPPSIVSEILTKLTWNSVPFSSIISARSVEVAMFFLSSATGLTGVVSGAVSSIAGLATPYITGIALRAATIARSFCPFSRINLIGGLLLTYLATSNVEQDIATLQAGTIALMQATIAGGRSVAEGTIARAADLGRAVNNSPGYAWGLLGSRMQAIALRASPILANSVAIGDRAAPIFALFGTGAALAADNLSGGMVALMRVTQSAGGIMQAAVARLPSLTSLLPDFPLGLPMLDGYDSDDASSVATAATAASVHSIQQLAQCIPVGGDPVIAGGDNAVLNQNLQASSAVLQEAEAAASGGAAGGGSVDPELEETILTATFVTTASASQLVIEQIEENGSCAAGGGADRKRDRPDDNSQLTQGSQGQELYEEAAEHDSKRVRTESQEVSPFTQHQRIFDFSGTSGGVAQGGVAESGEAIEQEEEEPTDEESMGLDNLFKNKGGRRTRRRRRNAAKAKRGKRKTVKKRKAKRAPKRR